MTSSGKEFTWIHAGTDVVRLRTAGIGAASLSGFTIFQRDDEGNLLARLDVDSAQWEDGRWLLSGVTITGGDGSTPRVEATREWDISLNPDSLDHLSTHPRYLSFEQTRRTEERRVGQEGVSPCRSRCWPSN